MSCSVFHLTATDNAPNCYAIKQGAKFSFILHYPEVDFTLWSFGGQIRASYDSTDVLGEFSFGPVTYGTREGYTGNWSSFEIYLPASITTALPPTNNREFRTDTAIPGKNVWVYDIEAYDPVDSENILKLIATSYVEVIPEVTRI